MRRRRLLVLLRAAGLGRRIGVAVVVAPRGRTLVRIAPAADHHWPAAIAAVDHRAVIPVRRLVDGALGAVHALVARATVGGWLVLIGGGLLGDRLQRRWGWLGH